MKMDKVANSGNDEFYTPKYAVEPILPFLRGRGFGKIWCPFDTEESWFVKELTGAGFTCIYSHISQGVDFFLSPVPECDCIISNPPYSIKGEVFQRLFEIGKPFAMLVGVVGLFESESRFTLFSENEFEVLYMNRRIAYFKDYSEQRPSLNPPFSSVYLCSRVLPKQICFSRIDKKKI